MKYLSPFILALLFLSLSGFAAEKSLLQWAAWPAHKKYLSTHLDNYVGAGYGSIEILVDGVWITPPQINRSQYFIAALKNMPAILELASQDKDFLSSLTAEQQKMFEGLRKFTASKTVDMQFSYDQGFFILDPKEVPRTATTTSAPDSYIMVNKLIINDPQVDLQFTDAVQLLVHELGHKIEKSSQEELDVLADKIKKALDKSILIKDLPRLGKMTILKSPLLVLFENTESITDHTQTLIKTLNPRQTLLSSAYPENPSSHKVEKKFSIADIKVYLGPLQNPILRLQCYYSQKFQTGPYMLHEMFDHELRAASLTFESDVKITENPLNPFKVLSSKAPFILDESKLIGEIKYRWLDEKRVEFTAQLPPSMQAQFPELLIENGKVFFKLKIQSLTADGKATWNLNIENATPNTSVLAQSVVIGGKNLVYSSQGVLLKFPTNDSPQKKLLLKSIQVTNTEPAENERGPAKTYTKLVFKSTSPIKEVRIAVDRSWDAYITSRVKEPQFMGGDMVHGSPTSLDSPDAYKRDIEFLSFTDDEFVQTRKGEYVEVEISKEEFLRHISIVAGRYSQNFSMFYSRTVVGKKTVGVDQGYRSIRHIEAVNASLEQVSTKWRTSIGYQLYRERSCRYKLRAFELLGSQFQ